MFNVFLVSIIFLSTDVFLFSFVASVNSRSRFRSSLLVSFISSSRDSMVISFDQLKFGQKLGNFVLRAREMEMVMDV